MKSAEERRETIPFNLQFFAAEGTKGEESVEDENIEDGQEGQQDANEDEVKDDKGGTKDDKKTSKSSGKTFTQEQVNRMMAREKNQGRDAALRELGIDPKDSKMVNMMKAFIESQKTDEQKDAEQKAAEAKELREANERALRAEAKAEAMQLGVKPQYVDDIITLVLNNMTDDADLKTLIGEYKTKYPVWFGVVDDDEDGSKAQKTGQKGTGSSVKASNKDKGDKGTESLGARLAAQRKGSNKKSSYWG